MVCCGDPRKKQLARIMHMYADVCGRKTHAKVY